MFLLTSLFVDKKFGFFFLVIYRVFSNQLFLLISLFVDKKFSLIKEEWEDPLKIFFKYILASISGIRPLKSERIYRWSFLVWINFPICTILRNLRNIIAANEPYDYSYDSFTNHVPFWVRNSEIPAIPHILFHIFLCCCYLRFHAPLLTRNRCIGTYIRA